MLSPVYKDTNNKLDEQISKLRKCKADMLAMFQDLDNLTVENYDSNNSYDTYRDASITSNSSFNQYSKSDSDSTVTDTEYDSDSYSNEDNLKSYQLKHRPVYSPANIKFTYKFPKNNQPLNSSTNNFPSQHRCHSSTSLQTPNEYSGKIFKPKLNNSTKPTWVQNGKIKNSIQKSNLSQSTTCLNLNKTRSSRSNSIVSSTSKSNPKLCSPWRPNGKFRAQSALFLSSQDLSKSTENLRKSSKKPGSKDVGQGWKPILGNSKSDLKVYSQPEVDRDPIKKVIVKRKIIVDKNDIGGGWKTILGKSKDNFFVEPEIVKDPIKTVIVKKKVIVDRKDLGGGWKTILGKPLKDDFFVEPEFEKDAIKTVVVKKKLFIDQKDVGKGWKPIGKSKEDIRISQDFIKTETQTTQEDKNKKKIFKDEKDIGNGWKPIGKPKEDKFFKSELDVDFKKSSEQIENKIIPKKNNNIERAWKPAGKLKEDMAIYTKPPIPVESASRKTSIKKDIANKKWIPSANKKYNHPNTWLENAYLKTGTEAKQNLKLNLNLDLKKISTSNSSSNKSKNKQMTSTPNMSKNFDDEIQNHLQESFISNEEKNDSKSSKNKIENSSIKKEQNVEANEDLNQNIENANGGEDENEIEIENREVIELDESVKSKNSEKNENKTEDSIFKRVDSKQEEDFLSKPVDESAKDLNLKADDEEEEETNFKDTEIEKNEEEETEAEEEEEDKGNQIWQMKDSDDE